MSMSTFSKGRLETIGSPPKHIRDKSICSTLTDDLREQYDRRSIRVIKGDTVKVMRGEYTGIEGKVEKVNTRRGTLSIEGIQREKVRGGNVKVQIHSSNVRVSGLNLDDKYRQNKIRRRDQQQETERKEPTREINDSNQKNKKKKKNKNKRIDNNTTKKRQLFKTRSRSDKTNKNSANQNKSAVSTDKKNKNKRDNSADNSQVTNQSKEEKRGDK
jgi:large subunit ribosomal protein L24